MFVEFKDGKKFSGKVADTYVNPDSFKDAGYVLTDTDLIVDIDCLPRDTIKKMIETFHIKTQVVWTERGAHLYFTKPTGFRGARSVCPLGFEVEYKHIANTKAVTVKRNGVLRDIENEGVRQDLPDFLYLRTKLESLMGLDEGDGRNQKLYAHKFKVMQVKNWKNVLRFINQHIFASPMDESELMTVIRDEQIKAEKDNEYEVAMALKTKLKIVRFGDALYSFNGTQYVTGDDFKRTLAKHLAGQKSRYVDEVIKQLEMHVDPVVEPSVGWDIKFKNGVLRNGRWIEIDSQEFTPFHVDLEYNPDAEPVDLVDTYLDFLTEGDLPYQHILHELMGHTLVTNPNVKRNLAKFFVFIGNGGNGKGTMLTIIRNILGKQNCSSLSPEEMTKEQYFTSLQHRLANLGDDIEDKAINEKQMKALKNISTCDYVSYRELFKQSKEIVVTTSLIFTSNHLLKSFEKGESYQRRVMWCPMFGVVKEKDPSFIDKLSTPEALQYWVRLMFEGYFRLYENKKFTFSQKVEDYNKEYHEQNNGCLTFVRDHKIEDFIGLRPPSVYEIYKTWVEENRGEGEAQSKRILKETIQSVMGLKVTTKKINGKTADVWDV